MSNVKDVLHSFIYIKLEGDKFENNVVSCLINHFKDLGYFYSPTFGDITFFSDNFMVPNNNNITIWYSMDSRDRIILSCNYVVFNFITHK